MNAQTIYLVTTALLVPGWLAVIAVRLRRQEWRRLTTRELTTLALIICLLQVVLLPFKGGLSRIPGLDALIFSIPYTVVLLLGLYLVPAPGSAASIILGQAVLGQLLGAGLNPVTLPYHLWVALVVEAWQLLPHFDLRRLRSAMALAGLRGTVAYGYSYGLLAPLLWRKHYAVWYVAMKIVTGLIGCLIGALLATRLAPRVEDAGANPLG